MDLQIASNSLQINFYKWTLADAQRELDNNFPLLRSIKGAMALRSLTLMEELPKEVQVMLFQALIKQNMSENLLASIDDGFTERDNELCNRFRYHTTIEPITYNVENQMYEQMAVGQVSFKINKSNFRKLINKELKPVLGEILSKRGNEWGYRVEFNSWRVETWIDIGGWDQLRYDHLVYITDGKNSSLPLVLTTNFQKWLGMGQTSWNFLTEEDMPAAAKTLAQLCSHFMNAIPTLLPIL